MKNWARAALLGVLMVFVMCQLVGCLPWPFSRKPAQGPDAPVVSRQGAFVPRSLPVLAPAESHQRTLWLLDHTEQYIVPFLLSVPKVEGMAREAVNWLVDTAGNRDALSATGLKFPLPATVSIRGLTIRNGLAKIDFNEQFLNIPAKLEKLAVDAVVYTLTEFPNVDRVEFMVGGKAVTQLSGGTSLANPLNRNTRALNIEGPAGKVGSSVILYFSSQSPKHEFNYYVPVTRVIQQTDNLIAASVQQLMAGPKEGSGLYKDLPENAKINSIRINAMRIAEIDLDKEWLAYCSDSVTEMAMIGALLLTITEHNNVDGIRITVDGKTVQFPKGTDVSRPIIRPAFVNPFIL